MLFRISIRATDSDLALPLPPHRTLYLAGWNNGFTFSGNRMLILGAVIGLFEADTDGWEAGVSADLSYLRDDTSE